MALQGTVRRVCYRSTAELHALSGMAGIEPATGRLKVEVTHLLTTVKGLQGKAKRVFFYVL